MLQRGRYFGSDAYYGVLVSASKRHSNPEPRHPLDNIGNDKLQQLIEQALDNAGATPRKTWPIISVFRRGYEIHPPILHSQLFPTLSRFSPLLSVRYSRTIIQACACSSGVQNRNDFLRNRNARRIANVPAVWKID